MTEQRKISRRPKHNKGQTCLFCGCYSREADIRRVQTEHKESEFICTDCLTEPETVLWMQAGGFA